MSTTTTTQSPVEGTILGIDLRDLPEPHMAALRRKAIRLGIPLPDLLVQIIEEASTSLLSRSAQTTPRREAGGYGAHGDAADPSGLAARACGRDGTGSHHDAPEAPDAAEAEPDLADADTDTRNPEGQN